MSGESQFVKKNKVFFEESSRSIESLSFLFFALLAIDEEESEQLGVGEETATYLVSTEVHYTNPKCLSVQLIKRAAIVESDKSLSHQLRLISLADASPFETLHSYVSHTLAPYFKSYVRRGTGCDPVADASAGAAAAAAGAAAGRTSLGGGAQAGALGVVPDLNSEWGFSFISSGFLNMCFRIYNILEFYLNILEYIRLDYIIILEYYIILLEYCIIL
jgi:hypothetical protein